jgi:hypothetical protein
MEKDSIIKLWKEVYHAILEDTQEPQPEIAITAAILVLAALMKK